MMCVGAHKQIYILTLIAMAADFRTFLDETLFVIVLYKQKAEESPAFQVLSSIYPIPVSIFLYDNSPTIQEVYHKGVTYVHASENNGVARGYNEGYRYGKTTGKKWLMLLDQDTQLTLSYLMNLPTVIQSFPDEVAFVPKLQDNVGIVSPFKWMFGRGIRSRAISSRLKFQSYRFLNSGLLISADAFEKAGQYNENISLYFSDIAFGEKLKTIKQEFIVVDHILIHNMSSTEKITLSSALHRYEFFCKGALAMGDIYGRTWLYTLHAFLRGAKLCFQYKDRSFLKIFFQLRS
jgi:GT2 family glycosyltransferase